MTTQDKITLRLFRYDPSADETPRYETYPVPYRKHMRVLDALNYIYDETGAGFAYRWYCGIKKCGECGITVNGRPMLSCWEPASEGMTCEPLANFPIIRDLAVERAHYEQIIMGLAPYIRRRKMPKFPERISHSKMKQAHKLSACIECNVCSAAVPVKGINTEGVDWSGYVGPSALVRFARFALDPRDEMDRSSLATLSGLKDFPLYPSLKDICPQGINIIEDALVPLRRKFLGGNGKGGDGGETKPVFIKARGWCAFVNLSAEQKEDLIRRGKLEAQSFPEMAEAYRLVEG